MTQAESEITTGVEYENDAPTKADVYAFVDDGEYATTWAVNRAGVETVYVLTFRCEAGLIEQDGEIKRFEVDPDQTTKDWAREYAEAHKTSVDVARDYWNSEEDR